MARSSGRRKAARRGAARRGVEMAFGVAVLALVAIGVVVIALNLLNQGKGGVTDIKNWGSLLTHGSNYMPDACEEWDRTDKPYDPVFILGGYGNPSLPSAAGYYGGSMACCQDVLKTKAEQLKSSAKLFGSDGDSLVIWDKCKRACEALLAMRTECGRELPSGTPESSADFQTCLRDKVSDYQGCSG